MNIVLIAFGGVCFAAGLVFGWVGRGTESGGGSGFGKIQATGPVYFLMIVLGLASMGWGTYRWEERQAKTPQDREQATVVPATDPPIIDDDTFPNGFTFGDNNQLDRLWRQCERSQWDACDQLYVESDIGSDYEWFGATCGGLPFNPNPDTEWCDPTNEG